MQLMRTMTLILIAVALAMPAFADCARVSTDGQSIWLEEGVNRRLVSTDPNGVLLPSWFGDRIAYARERVDGSGILRTEIVVLKENGDIVRVISVPEDAPVNGVMQLGWRDSKRVFIEAHVNPATTLFLAWSVGSGDLDDERAGSRFAVSPNGRSVAQRQHVPLGAPVEFDSAVLEVDGAAVYPATDDGQHHRFLTSPVWAHNSHRLALIEEVAGEIWLVTVSLNGNHVKTTRLPLSLTGVDPRVSWSGGAHVIVRTEDEALRIHPESGKIDAPKPGEGDSDDCSK
jgi:hypothetical protein